MNRLSKHLRTPGSRHAMIHRHNYSHPHLKQWQSAHVRVRERNTNKFPPWFLLTDSGNWLIHILKDQHPHFQWLFLVPVFISLCTVWGKTFITVGLFNGSRTHPRNTEALVIVGFSYTKNEERCGDSEWLSTWDHSADKQSIDQRDSMELKAFYLRMQTGVPHGVSRCY